MSTLTILDEVVAKMEIVFDLLDLLSGKGYPPFFNSQSYLRRVIEYCDKLDESGRAFVKAVLVWLRDGEPPKRIVAYYCDCVREKKEETRQWLNRLNVQIPPELTAILDEEPTEEMCRQGLQDHAAYALELLNENGS